MKRLASILGIGMVSIRPLLCLRPLHSKHSHRAVQVRPQFVQIGCQNPGRRSDGQGCKEYAGNTRRRTGPAAGGYQTGA